MILMTNIIAVSPILIKNIDPNTYYCKIKFKIKGKASLEIS